ncbi:DUF2203 domain-containing protein [Alteribacillus sp. YIM 98480]|uniref:DUF2203 domain-containing protein n=1 Tax=Alteribacillus sp. YIM 98480 TaxID=2606599 RepID=UPI00131B4C7C|nr:DUF2203 domain-containing protein [Alteribacillus sp. YIM 98480]
MFSKYLTLQEANDLLPSVREELVHLQSLERECKTVHHHLKAVKKGALEEVTSREEDIFLLETGVDFLEIQAQCYVSQLEKNGIYIKSIDEGLVDFPAKVEGNPVLLCWKQGEEFITHYHHLFESFKKRKKIYSTDDR